MPISSTITSVSSGLSRMVTGRPCSLLKLRGLAAVRRVLASAAASRSLVEVLPTDPVMPTTSVRPARARPAPQRHQRRGGVVDLDHGAVRRDGPATRPDGW